MIRKLFLMVVAVCVVALLSIGIWKSISETRDFNKAIADLNNLTKITNETIGENPTKDSLAKAQKYLDENKNEVRNKLISLREKGIIKVGSERETALTKAFENHQTQFAQILDHLTKKSDQEVEELNKITEKMNSVSFDSKEYKKLKKDLENQIKKMKETTAVFSGLNNIISSYLTINQ